MTRQLATIRRIKEIKAHPNADKLDIAIIDGWQLVTAKTNGFKTGDLVVYLEIDSWVPNEVAPFLTKQGHESKEFEGVKGERLRTIKLRGELSQGLILPLNDGGVAGEGDDVTEALGIKKYEKPLPAQLQGRAKGNFPIFIPKTDQERVQNIFGKLSKRDPYEIFEASLKLDGSSMTVYKNEDHVGVCSRNLELLTDESVQGNAFVDMFRKLNLEERLRSLGRNIAIQGELWGEGINGNWEGVKGHFFNVFDIYDIDSRTYLSSYERHVILADLNIGYFNTDIELKNSPLLEAGYVFLCKFQSVEDYLAFANRPSVNNSVAEGVVFKSHSDPNFSFKVINNDYLLNGGE